MLISPAQLQASTVPFLQLLSPNAKFHSMVELTVQKMQYGEVTFAIEIKNGVVDLESVKRPGAVIVRKRIKY